MASPPLYSSLFCGNVTSLQLSIFVVGLLVWGWFFFYLQTPDIISIYRSLIGLLTYMEFIFLGELESILWCL